MTSSLGDPHDLTRRLDYLVGPLVGASDNGGGHGSMAASSPAVKSSPRDLRDLAHWVCYSVGPLIGAMHGGGTHGRTEVRADGETPVEATVAQSNTTPSITELRRT